MNNMPGILQKTASVSAYISFVLAATCAGFLYFAIDQSGANNPVSASFMAAIFFFIFVGIVLLVIGKTNLPSFNPDDISEKDLD